jgi:hypothetical protein
MSISVFEEKRVQDVIERFGSAQKMGVFVGAGASIEAGLPTWEKLVVHLLNRAAMDANLFSNDMYRKTWVDATLRVESLPGAASIAERLLGNKFRAVLREALFDDTNYYGVGQPTASEAETRVRKTAEDYFPGQIALQVAFSAKHSMRVPGNCIFTPRTTTTFLRSRSKISRISQTSTGFTPTSNRLKIQMNL